jgi:uncharacterized protein
MGFSLYDATIPAFQQMLGSMSHLLDTAEAHCNEHGLAHSDIIDARLAADMLPFAYQVKSTAVHSIGAIEGVRKGVFNPDMIPPPATFAELKQRISTSLATLQQLEASEINGFEGCDMRFEMGDYRLNFTAENFLMSFSLPNLFFHTTAAYSILRMKGVALGKRDYMGKIRKKT